MEDTTVALMLQARQRKVAAFGLECLMICGTMNKGSLVKGHNSAAHDPTSRRPMDDIVSMRPIECKGLTNNIMKVIESDI